MQQVGVTGFIRVWNVGSPVYEILVENLLFSRAASRIGATYLVTIVYKLVRCDTMLISTLVLNVESGI